MYERSLNEAESFLQATEKPWLSVQELWNEVVKLSQIEQFEVAPLPEFTAMLDADPRFQIIPAREEGEPVPELPPDSDIEENEMEQLGFYPEDRVRLKAKPAPEDEQSEIVVIEEEEEVGSIRRRAFVASAHKSAKKAVKKKTRVLKRTTKKQKVVKKVYKKKSAKKSVPKKKSIMKSVPKKKKTLTRRKR
ncbi:MAG TPA: hypothetical protein PK595_07580 [Bacteroidota bacterium]|nr:hypothetical protein [Bacteroidota bacterium]